MQPSTGRILVIIRRSLTDSHVRQVNEWANGLEVAALCCGPAAEGTPLPPEWVRWTASDFIQPERLRSDLLSFLEAWPRRGLRRGCSFDELLRRPSGYSLWWTGPGVDKHPDKGVFLKMRLLWISARAMDQAEPAMVVLGTNPADMTDVLASRCQRAGVALKLLPGCKRPRRSVWGGGARWWASSLVKLLLGPLLYGLTAMHARLVAGAPRREACRPDGDAVVITARYPQDCRDGSVWFWEAAVRSLTEAGLRPRYLFNVVVLSRPGLRGMLASQFPSVARGLRQMVGRLPLARRFVCLGRFYVAACAQMVSMWRYMRLERSSAFRESFVFAGADVARWYVPALRQTVAGIASWERTVAAIRRALKRGGGGKALLVLEEMYPRGMQVIAAARSLGISTIGIQHGTLFPMHLIYALSPGQVVGSPSPDYFAAYGQYAADVLSKQGAFPAERIWITGGPRFDHLVDRPVDPAAMRRQFDLPTDKRIVLVATQKYPWFPEAVRAVFEAVRDRTDVMVVMKTHVRDVPMEIYHRLAAETGIQHVRFFLEHFNELLAACDVLVSGSSTTMFEAALLGKRMVCVNFSDEPDRYPYVANGASLPARDNEQTKVSLHHALSDADVDDMEARRQAFLAYHAGSTAEGKAAETLARRIAALDAVVDR